jgi:hypothetical protein
MQDLDFESFYSQPLPKHYMYFDQDLTMYVTLLHDNVFISFIEQMSPGACPQQSSEQMSRRWSKLEHRVETDGELGAGREGEGRKCGGGRKYRYGGSCNTGSRQIREWDGTGGGRVKGANRTSVTSERDERWCRGSSGMLSLEGMLLSLHMAHVVCRMCTLLHCTYPEE